MGKFVLNGQEWELTDDALWDLQQTLTNSWMRGPARGLGTWLTMDPENIRVWVSPHHDVRLVFDSKPPSSGPSPEIDGGRIDWDRRFGEMVDEGEDPLAGDDGPNG